jgi:hypothetical protein
LRRSLGNRFIPAPGSRFSPATKAAGGIILAKEGARQASQGDAASWSRRGWQDHNPRGRGLGDRCSMNGTGCERWTVALLFETRIVRRPRRGRATSPPSPRPDCSRPKR